MNSLERIRLGLRVAAWVCLAAIAVATVAPIGFRPVTGLSPSIERFVAFALAGGLFALAYPRYILFGALIVLGAAVLFELLQLFQPSRHGRMFDAGVKLAGGIAGLVVGRLLARIAPRR